MEKNFWIQKWKKKEIAFHQSQVNPHLKLNFEKLNLKKGSRVFLPLCGKTLDIAWLLSQGYQVVGAELVETAIQELFAELEIKPQITHLGKFNHYAAQNIDIFVGDIFELSKEVLGRVDAIYDRAALVALPKELREKYTKHLMDITNKAAQLLVVYEYDQNKIQGPPFSLSADEIKKHYENEYHLILIDSVEVPGGGMKGQVPAKENVWLLEKR